MKKNIAKRLSGADVVVYGCGSLDIFKLFGAINKDRKNKIYILGILDDTLFKSKNTYNSAPVLGGREKIKDYKDYPFINNVFSSPQARKKVNGFLDGCDVISVIHPNTDLNGVHVGNGIHITAGVLLGGGVVLMDNVVLRAGCNITHDCYLGEYVFVGPSAVLCGSVKVGDMAYIGAGAIIKQKVKIGEGAVVGAGAVVVKDVTPGTTVVGCPAKEIEYGTGRV